MVEVFNYKTHIFDVVMNDQLQVRSVGKVLNRELLPVCLLNDMRPDTVQKWIRSRMIPANRIDRVETQKLFGNSDIARPHNMFSLSDQYWFRWEKSETWARRNFFTNEFYTEHGRMYFEPETVDLKLLKKENPDMTTNGVLKKRWVRDEEGKQYLIKMGSRSAHQDPISEILASMTLARLNIIPFVRYELVVDGRTYCSRCENFIHAGEEFIPAGDFYFLESKPETSDRRTHLISMLKKYAPGLEGIEDYLDRMAVADYCIGNNDRHAYNFGLIRDCSTGKIKGFAPLFDSGSVFFGNPNTDGQKSKVFTDQQVEEAIKRIFKMNPPSVKKFRPDNLVRFVDCYPLLTEEEKKRIISCITALYDEIRERIQGQGAKPDIGLER